MFSFFPFRFHNARSRRPKDGGLRDMEGGRCVLSNGGIRLGSKEKSFDRGRPDCDYDLSVPVSHNIVHFGLLLTLAWCLRPLPGAHTLTLKVLSLSTQGEKALI